jgi:hypothetical protein
MQPENEHVIMKRTNVLEMEVLSESGNPTPRAADPAGAALTWARLLLAVSCRRSARSRRDQRRG